MFYNDLTEAAGNDNDVLECLLESLKRHFLHEYDVLNQIHLSHRDISVTVPMSSTNHELDTQSLSLSTDDDEN